MAALCRAGVRRAKDGRMQGRIESIRSPHSWVVGDETSTHGQINALCKVSDRPLYPARSMEARSKLTSRDENCLGLQGYGILLFSIFGGNVAFPADKLGGQGQAAATLTKDTSATDGKASRSATQARRER
ncbi:hypothetical protein CIHG_06245 [Coccidioides immitis H538.4]|uniref:Uncharacterized protein n=2 Tax=Coccidioides immitis TaxID=5501 RepID=A0A0J8RT97_COCIT|nr:hypothetical protein CIRG_09520 [Coccidioides immitis RMSCC 2394]KMU88445.1 hypothetical protein CIHG_06245 [Coccidioides immitis H538.4]